MSLGLPDISCGTSDEERQTFRVAKTTSNLSYYRTRPISSLNQRRGAAVASASFSRTSSRFQNANINSSPPSIERARKKSINADRDLESLLEDVNAMTDGVDKLLNKLRYQRPRNGPRRRRMSRGDRHAMFGLPLKKKKSLACSPHSDVDRSRSRRTTRSLPDLGSIKKNLMAKRQREKTLKSSHRSVKMDLKNTLEGNDGMHEHTSGEINLAGGSPSSFKLASSFKFGHGNDRQSKKHHHLGKSKSYSSGPVARRALSLVKARAAVSMQYGACSIAGCKSGSTTQKRNQDSYVVVDNFIETGQMLFGLFDGHGSKGGTVSRFCSSRIAGLLEKLSFTPAKATSVFQSAFLRLQRMLHHASFDASNSGSTALVCVITPKDRHNRQVVVASIGDSRCCISTTVQGKGNNLSAPPPSARTRLSRMVVQTEFFHEFTHSPEEHEEAKRIIHAGGYVWAQPGDVCRVWLSDPEIPDTMNCGIAMTRSLGDFHLHKVGVTCIPEVVMRTLSSAEMVAAEAASGHPPFVVLGSDGVWDQFQLEEVGSLLYRSGAASLRAAKSAFAPTVSAKERCFQLCKEAVSRWKSGDSDRVDDVSAIVIKL